MRGGTVNDPYDVAGKVIGSRIAASANVSERSSAA
jgi:hypothetical protein